MKIQFNAKLAKSKHYFFCGVKMCEGVNEVPDCWVKLPSFQLRVDSGIFTVVQEAKPEQKKTTRKPRAKKTPTEITKDGSDDQ